MCDKIEDYIEQTFKISDVRCYKPEFNLYNIEIHIQGLVLLLSYKWDNHFTENVNLKNIEEEIDKTIIKEMKK